MLGLDHKKVRFQSLFLLLEATLRAESTSSFIFAFPTPHGPFPNTQWVQTLIKYLTKVTKKPHSSTGTLSYPGSFTCVSRGTFSSLTQHTEAEFTPSGSVPAFYPFQRA